MKVCFYHTSEQVKYLANLFSNKLGEMYTSIVLIMGLPVARQAQRLCAKECDNAVYSETCTVDTLGPT